MSKYTVTVTETLRREVEIDADSLEEAKDRVYDDWADGKIILDADDFKEVDFDAEEKVPEKLKVVILEPDKIARVGEIGSELEDLQEAVDGFIEAGYYFDDHACIVCNEEGKINGLPLNRGIYDEDKNLIHIIAGKAFICGCGVGTFSSLTTDQQKKYMKEFKYPERFYQKDNEIVGVKFKPASRELEK